MQSSIIAKMLSVLTVISEAREPLTFSELVNRTGLNKSTIHRLLSIAVEENMVQHDAARKTYLIGPKLFDLVRNAYQGTDIQEVALDEMVRLHGLVGVNVALGVPGGLEVVYLRILEASNSMGGMQRTGTGEPIHCSASGKALLAFLPDKVIDAKLKGYVFEQFTAQTITDEATLRLALAETRKAGFGANDREQYDQRSGISAPIFNYMGEPMAVLNIWSDHSLHSLADLKGWSAELKASAHRITMLIGGITPEAVAESA